MTKIEIQNLKRVAKEASAIARIAENFQDMTDKKTRLDKMTCLNMLRALRSLCIIKDAQTYVEQTIEQYDNCIDDYLMTIDEHIENIEASLNAN